MKAPKRLLVLLYGFTLDEMEAEGQKGSKTRTWFSLRDQLGRGASALAWAARPPAHSTSP